jgi:lipopolysaccharide transport system permease protein
MAFSERPVQLRCQSSGISDRQTSKLRVTHRSKGWLAMSVSNRISAANDVIEGLCDWRIWLRLAWYDIIARFRRSWVGPLWLIATTILFVLSLGVVYSILFNTPITDFLPYVAVGLVVWSFISSATSESLQTFVEAEIYMKQVRRSPIVYVCRVVSRNVIVFANQFLVALIVVIAFNKFSIWHLPLALIGIIALASQAVWLSIVLGILGTRFRDLMPLVQSILQITFLVTPIVWPSSALGSKIWIAEINPFYHFVEIVRLPMLGEIPSVASYSMVACITAIGFGSALYFYRQFAHRIIYWL